MRIIVLVLLAPLILVVVLILPFVYLWRSGRQAWLRWRFHRVFGAQGRFVVFVYSNSPRWKERIETTVLPRLRSHAVVLNWSERSSPAWAERPLEVQIFREWGGKREFNPIAILLPPTGRVEVIRFFQAYRDHGHGKRHLLDAREAELFSRIDELAAAHATRTAAA